EAVGRARTTPHLCLRHRNDADIRRRLGSRKLRSEDERPGQCGKQGSETHECPPRALALAPNSRSRPFPLSARTTSDHEPHPKMDARDSDLFAAYNEEIELSKANLPTAKRIERG